jgi:hypothetical protein
VVIDTSRIPLSRVEWRRAVRIIRSVYLPIDLFEDIANPTRYTLRKTFAGTF